MDFFTLAMMKKFGGGKLPFGEKTTTTMGDTLTWDGNTEGLENAPSPTVEGMTIYKISDNAITFADLSQGLTVTANGETETITPDMMLDAGMAVVFDFGLFVNEESAETPEYTVGIYVFDFVSSLTIPGYNGFETTETVIIPLDEKYMPVLTSPNGTKYKISVADDGTISATAV